MQGRARPRARWGRRRRGAQPPEQRDSGPVTHESYGRRAGGRGCRFRLDVRKGAPYGMPPTALRGRGGLAPPSTGFPHTPFECLNDVIPHYPGRCIPLLQAGAGLPHRSAGCKFKIGASTGPGPADGLRGRLCGACPPASGVRAVSGAPRPEEARLRPLPSPPRARGPFFARNRQHGTRAHPTPAGPRPDFAICFCDDRAYASVRSRSGPLGASAAARGCGGHPATPTRVRYARRGNGEGGDE